MEQTRLSEGNRRASISKPKTPKTPRDDIEAIWAQDLQEKSVYQGIQIFDASHDGQVLIAGRPKVNMSLISCLSLDLNILNYDVNLSADLLALCAGKVLGRIDGGAHKGMVRDVSIEYHARLIASCGDDGRIVVWDISAGKSEKVIDAHNGAIFQIEFLSDSQTLLSAGEDGRVYMWDWRTGDKLKTFMKHPSAVLSFDYTEIPSHVICGRADGHITVWNTDHLLRIDNISPDLDWIENPEEESLIGYNNLLTGHSGAIVCIKVAPNGWILATGSTDHTVKIWNILSYRKDINSIKQEIKKSADSFTEVNEYIDITNSKYSGIEREKNFFCVGQTHLTSTYHADIIFTLQHNASVLCLSFSPNSALIATGLSDSTCCIWSSWRGTQLFTISTPAPTNSILIANETLLYCSCQSRLLIFNYKVKNKDNADENEILINEKLYNLAALVDSSITEKNLEEKNLNSIMEDDLEDDMSNSKNSRSKSIFKKRKGSIFNAQDSDAAYALQLASEIIQETDEDDDVVFEALASKNRSIMDNRSIMKMKNNTIYEGDEPEEFSTLKIPILEAGKKISISETEKKTILTEQKKKLKDLANKKSIQKIKETKLKGAAGRKVNSDKFSLEESGFENEDELLFMNSNIEKFDENGHIFYRVKANERAIKISARLESNAKDEFERSEDKIKEELLSDDDDLPKVKIWKRSAREKILANIKNLKTIQSQITSDALNIKELAISEEDSDRLKRLKLRIAENLRAMNENLKNGDVSLIQNRILDLLLSDDEDADDIKIWKPSVRAQISSIKEKANIINTKMNVSNDLIVDDYDSQDVKNWKKSFQARADAETKNKKRLEQQRIRGRFGGRGAETDMDDYMGINDTADDADSETEQFPGLRRISMEELKVLSGHKVLLTSAFETIAKTTKNVDLEQLAKNMKKYNVHPQQIMRLLLYNNFTPEQLFHALSRRNVGVSVLYAMIIRRNPISGYMARLGYSPIYNNDIFNRKTVFISNKDVETLNKNNRKSKSGKYMFDYGGWYNQKWNKIRYKGEYSYSDSEDDNYSTFNQKEDFQYNQLQGVAVRREQKTNIGSILHFVPSMKIKLLKDLNSSRDIQPIFLRQLVIESETGTKYPNFKLEDRYKDYKPSFLNKITEQSKKIRFNETLQGERMLRKRTATSKFRSSMKSNDAFYRGPLKLEDLYRVSRNILGNASSVKQQNTNAGLSVTLEHPQTKINGLKKSRFSHIYSTPTEKTQISNKAQKLQLLVGATQKMSKIDFNNLLLELQEFSSDLNKPTTLEINHPKTHHTSLRKVQFTTRQDYKMSSQNILRSIIKNPINPNAQVEQSNPEIPISDYSSDDDSSLDEYSYSDEDYEEDTDPQYDSNQDEDLDLDSADDTPVDSNIDSDIQYSNTLDIQNATLEDYEDMDGLLSLLDKFIVKNKLNPQKETSPISPSLQSLPPNFTLPDGSDTDSDDEKLHTIKAVPSSNKKDIILAKLQTANIKKITTRIYIQDSKVYHTLPLTSLMTADNIIQILLKAIPLENTPSWTLFELCNDLGIERPIRSWEIVTRIISAWDIESSTNAIVLQKYSYYQTIGTSSITGKIPTAQGYLYLELQRGKWHKRFCFIKGYDLYYLKEANNSQSETFYCSLKNYDAFTLSKSIRRKTPTEFAFALRSTNSRSVFENKDEYCHFICVEKQERLFDWILAFRLTMTEYTFNEFPEYFEDYEISEKANQRRWAAKDSASKIISPTYNSSSTILDRIEAKSSKQPEPDLKFRSVKPLLTFEAPNFREPPPRKHSSSKSSEPRRKEGDHLRHRRHSKEVKTLVDVPDISKCKTCGCVDFRSVFAGGKDAQCGNCLHIHLE